MNLWHSVYDVLAKVTRWSAIVAVVCAVVVLLMSVIDVTGAKFFNWGLPGALELTEQLNLVLVFMAVAYVQLERGHMRVNLLETFMSAGLQHAIRLFSHVLGILVCGFFSWRTLVLMQNMIAAGEYKYGRIEFPLWPFGFVNFYGFALLTVAFILCLGKGIIAGSEK